ncbi:NAD-dependent epimerase/dehydratase family protein [Candidatus Pelagibacter bacterium]|nr:NAD-dependent epimerase/dehydratase family protein [Candidatus Pelagibacter bacterium]MDA8834331.1 NAD-dependent epimerase/dehydratase family protein [Candidatus Pelagibacter bacterium]
MKNIIVVTGGAGFIGSNLIKYLIKKTKFKIISIDNYSTGTKKNHVKHKNIKYIKDKNINISKLLKNYKKRIKVIFHFGEFSRIYQSFLKPRECLESNINNSFAVINFAKDNKIKIIYSATSSALGNNGKDENLSPYAWAKTKNIELIKNYSKWFGLKYELLFFYNVYGPGQILSGPMSAVIGIFETQFKKKIPLTIVKPGSQKRDFTHIDDIIRGCYLAFIKGRQDEYMLCSKKQYTILQIAKMFKTKIKFLPKRKGDRSSSSVPNNNSLNHLRYIPKIHIKDYINSMLKKSNF